MVNASALPALFAASTWVEGGSFLHDGSKLLASIGGVWVETVDPDGVRIAEVDFGAIAGAVANVDGSLTIAGSPKHVAAMGIDGVRWIWIIDPE